jgi:hypothetical protein
MEPVMHDPTFTPPIVPRPALVPARPPAGELPELVQVIVAEHARILRLFAALANLGRRQPSGTCGRTTLIGAWQRLASLVDMHADAEEEICYEVLFGYGGHIAALLNTAVADHNDIREAVAEARLAEAGSASWWRAVATAHRACTEHFASEEQGVLAYVCAQLTPETGKLLARQWAAFTAAGHGARYSRLE